MWCVPDHLTAIAQALSCCCYNFIAADMLKRRNAMFTKLMFVIQTSFVVCFCQCCADALVIHYQGHGRVSGHRPELLLNNFNTRLGRRVGRMLGSLFHQDPQFRGRRVVTFHNQRDFIFFR